MAQLLRGKEKTYVQPVAFMRCDRCGVEAEITSRGGGIEGWVGCVRLTALFSSPPIEAYPDLKPGEEVLAATPNATHACPKCWEEIETFARAKKSEAA